MTLSNETIELIEKKIIDFYGDNPYSFGSQRDGARWAAQNLFTDPAILASVKGEEWVKYDLQNFPKNSEPVFIKYDGYKDVAYYEDGKWINTATDKELPALFIKSLEWLNEKLHTPSSTEQLRRIRVKSIIPGAMGICDYHLENGEVITCKPNELVSEYDKKYGSDTVVKCIAHGDCKGNPCIYPECMTKDLLNAEAFYNSRSRNSTPSSTVDLEREAEELAEKKFPYPEWYGTQSQNNESTADIILEIDKSRYDFVSSYIELRQTSQKGLEELIEWLKVEADDLNDSDNLTDKAAAMYLQTCVITKATELLTKK